MEIASTLGEVESLQVRSKFFILLAICLPETSSNFEGYLETLDFPGAEERNRTSDLLITNQLLYQLSYFSIKLKVVTNVIIVNEVYG